MLRVLADFLMIIICFILQNTVFQALALASISPNLLVILTSSMGLMRGKKEGMLVGFFCGFLVDIFYGEIRCPATGVPEPPPPKFCEYWKLHNTSGDFKSALLNTFSAFFSIE